MRHELEGEAERRLESCRRIAGGEERFCAAIETLASFDVRLSALRALFDDRVEPFIAQIVLELLRVLRERRRSALIADPVQSRLVDPHEARGLAARLSDHRILAGVALRKEALDVRRHARHRIALHLLSDAQPRADDLARGRTKRRRLDPEVVRERGGRGEEKESERESFHVQLTRNALDRIALWSGGRLGRRKASVTLSARFR